MENKFNKTTLVAAAVAGLMLSSCSSAPKPPADVVTGECYGINACKGQGECGGTGHSCAGKNTCKGKGWVTLSHVDCDAKGGTFKSEKTN